MYIMYTGALISADGTYTGSVTGFSPIGTQNKPFKGTFDGNNYTICGVYVTNAPNAGLFGYVNSATIRNVTVANSYVQGTGRVGGICGYADNSTAISGCTNRAYVVGGPIAGGICGELADHSTVSACGNEGAVSSTSTAAGGATPTVGIGGICGVVNSGADSAAIQNSYNFYAVSATCDNVGGIAGYSSAAIEACYNAGAVSGKQYVGGICGMQNGKQIQNVYNLESVSGTSYVGGIVGYAEAYVMSAYSIGSVSGQDSGDISGSSHGEQDVYTKDDLKKSTQLPSGFSASVWEMQTGGAEYAYPTLIALLNPNLGCDEKGDLAVYPITLVTQEPNVPLPEGSSADVKVEYRAAVTPSTVYSVDIRWGSMAFVYTAGSVGTWNPNTHAYEGQTSGAWTCAQGANVVTIINHSNTALTAKLSYQPLANYTAVQGAFNNTSLPLASAVGTSQANAPTATGTLTLQGDLNSSSDGQLVVGKVSVAFE
ncbi:MAG: hypothetical protein IJY66_06505 [Clostridia bacterium]|nr:hypothetical protein [Clostridia bacterium]